jgi:hypothetical protein
MRRGEKLKYMCPVCFFDKLTEAPKDYNICDCCGTEFGNDDELRSYAELRADWIARGARWFYEPAPALWNPWRQLALANVRLPYASLVQHGGSAPILVAPRHRIDSYGNVYSYDNANSPVTAIPLFTIAGSGEEFDEFEDLKELATSGVVVEYALGMAA